MLITEPEEPDFGCLHAFLAYLYAVYVLAAPLSFSEVNAPGFIAILFAPLIFPVVAVFGLFAGEKSEVGPSGEGVAMALLFFLAVVGVMLFLVRQSQRRSWVGWLLGSTVVGLLVASYCKSI